MMETYHGIVRTPADAIKLFEACRVGLLSRVQCRLSKKERQSIRSGSVFVWDEREAGMRRWTDGKSWSASRVSGSFLAYREIEGKRGGGFGTSRRSAGKTLDSGRGSDEVSEDGEPKGYRYKTDGLMKQTFSITTSQGQHLHLISYYSRPHPSGPELPQPSTDPSLRQVVPVKDMYPESSLNDHPVPVTTRNHVATYPHLPPLSEAYHPQYAQQPSPVARSPYSHYTVAGHYAPAPLPHPHHAHLPAATTPYPPQPHDMAGPLQSRPLHNPRLLPPAAASVESRVTPPTNSQVPVPSAVAAQPAPPAAGGGGSRRIIPGHLPAVLAHSGSNSSTLPPKALLQSSPGFGSGNDSSNNRASLSAILHPARMDSEPNSANPGSNSTTSSPRGAGNSVSGS